MIIDLTEDDEGHQGQPKAPTVVAPRMPLPSSAPIVQDQGLPLPIPVSNPSPHQIILQNYMSNRYQAQTQLPSSTFPLLPANLPYNATYRNLPHPANPLAQNQMIYHPPQTQPMPPPSTVKRVLPATVTSTPAPVSAYQANMATRAAATNNTTTKIAVESLNVKFSVVDHQYFTARAETGHVTSSILDCLKRTPGAKFDKASSRWLFPFGSHQVLFHALQKNRCQVEMIPHGIIAAAQLKINKNSSDDQLFVSQVLEPLVGPKVLGHLAPFQQEAVKFIHDKKGRALIADEMGLGKTRTAIGGALLYQEHWPTLIVCPSSARFHWQAELLAILSPEIIDAREVTVVENGQHAIVSNSSQYAYKFVIISYSLVAKLQERLQKSNFGVVIADESHYLKTRKALRTKALLPLIHAAKCALLLSGTPALSRPVELFTQLHALQPTQWNDFKAFGKRYCVDPRPNKEKSMYNSHNRFNFGENAFKGANNTQELHVILTSTIMIRRLKKDILTQLPQKKRYLVKVGVEDDAERRRLRGMLSQLSQYEELLKKRKVTRTKHRRAYADEGDDGNDNDDNDVGEEAQGDPLDDAKQKRKSLLMELFRDSGIAKLPSILKQLQRFLDVDGSGKVLVFAHHRNVLDGVCRFLRDHDVDFIRIDGMTASSDRHQRTQQFQTDAKIRVGVLGITAAGIALTLTAAHVVFFAEMFWTPGSLIQAEDRAHRIGQTRDVKIFYFFAESTIDELLWPLVRKKLQLLGEIVEGKSGLDLAAQAKDEVTTKARAVAAAAAAAAASRTDSSQELGNNNYAPAGEGTVTAASSSSSTLTVGMKRKSTTENVYKDEEGRLVFDLLEDDDDFEELMHEMVRESTAEFQAAATTTTDHSSDDDADADAAEAQPDDYEEYLKRSVPPDKLASSYLKELAEKEKRTLEHWQQKYAAQEDAIREHPTLGSFLSESQSMERTVFQDTSPSKMNHDFSAIMDEAADNEPVKSEVAAAVQGVSSSNHSSRPVVIDLLDSSDDDDDDDEPVERSIAGYPDGERVEVDIPSSAPPPPPLPPPPHLLSSSDAPVGFNKLRDAVAKRASSKTASPPSSSASVPSMSNAAQEGDYPCPGTYTR